MTELVHQRAYAKKSRIHGTGLFASEDIAKGERIMEYTGEKITKAEAARRYEDQADKGVIYLFDLNKRYDVDGSIHGNDAKYANHSCDGNAETDIVQGRIWIVARKDIKKGEEITYDYNFPSLDYEERPCRCGTPNCRKYIVGKGALRHLKKKWAEEEELERKIATRPEGSPLAVVNDSPIHGKGLFANHDIYKGEEIVEYTGDLVDKDEAEDLYEKQWAEGHIFLFELDDDWDIDGSHPDNEARWANHSCDPNTDTEILEAEDDDELDEVWLVAKRDIKKGEEITYDYNLPTTDYRDRPCKCGAETCRGYIIGKDGYRYLKRKGRLNGAKRA